MAASDGAGQSNGVSTEFFLKEISPRLGGASLKKDNKTCSSNNYDLVKRMKYLYVRVVKARGIASLFGGSGSGSGIELFAEVELGNNNYRGVTKMMSNAAEWDQVFAISEDGIQRSSSTVTITVKKRRQKKVTHIGGVLFYLNAVPLRVPPDSELEPQWYRMEDKNYSKTTTATATATGELMVSLWFGTQADESFAESLLNNVHPDVLSFTKSTVYIYPKLWCLRVSIIEARDIMPAHKGSQVVRFPRFSVTIQFGDRSLTTKVAAPSATRSFSNPCWDDEELLFLVAEPFDENDMLVSVEDQVEPRRNEIVAKLLLPMATIERRIDDEKQVNSRWFNLDCHFEDVDDDDDNNKKKVTMMSFVSRIHLRVSLDGGYNLLDEDTRYNCCDVNPVEKRFQKPLVIGVLEMGILSATGLLPMKRNERCSIHAYCVAKYEGKWFRTRTVVDSFNPEWNEQYAWEVNDPCTVVTIGVFHNHRIDDKKITTKNIGPQRDDRFGKIRIRLSTLENDRVYTHSYPLMMLFPPPYGLKKMGELQLAVRFSCTSVAKMLYKYTIPVLPKMHYVHPLSADQLERLRNESMNVVASRLSIVEPPLGKEVVEYMLDHKDSPSWSLRRSKAFTFRLLSLLSGVIAMVKWLESIRNWENSVYSTLFLIIFLTLVMLPEFILSTILFYLVFVGLWNYRYRPLHPLYFDTRLSHTHCHPDELEEEFDTFPTSNRNDIVRMRYDRMRTILGRLQTVMGDIATLVERFEALVSWRDPRATFLFLVCCLVAAVVCYVFPIRVVVALLGLFSSSPPRFRSKLTSSALNFYKRLPSKDDDLISEIMGRPACLDIEGLLIISILEDFQQSISLFV
ncbi:hypothetical protein RIF29_23352 [Crotalaria pallida]|uniref:C2 domain-containing protein n=1 Tax=Crotalaria pallida TaxID=3830 RepID=A0AAN9FEE5_CROPI